jgi:hypothetical protein
VSEEEGEPVALVRAQTRAKDTTIGPEDRSMRYSIVLSLVAMLASGCSSNKSADNPRPNASWLDSAANRVARDTVDTTGHRDTTTSR